MKKTAVMRPSESETNHLNLYRNCFSIGGITVEVSGDRAEDAALVPSLRPFQIDSPECDIRIRVQWTADLNSRVKCPLFDSGRTWRCYEDDAGLQFDFNAPVFGARPYKRLQIDRHFERAVLKMNATAFADFPFDAEPLEYPLDELLIMHRLTQERAVELHASGIVGPDGVGNLFVGHSGAGKSTTTRLWTAREDVTVLSDDRIILRAENSSMGFVSSDRGGHDRIQMYGTPWHGEAMFASPEKAPLAAIFVLEHGSGNNLTELSPSEAVAELFARGFVPFHCHEYVDSALRFLQELVSRVPCYRFAFAPNPAAVEAILTLRH